MNFTIVFVADNVNLFTEQVEATQFINLLDV